MKNLAILTVATFLFSTACSQQIAFRSAGISPCHIMFDAGSSGTRLYIYEQQGSEWISHEGPSVGALADPVRENWSDAQQMVNNIVDSLDEYKETFDWSTHCNIESASIFATAGMRLAEQENRSRSEELWAMLNGKLQEELSMPVSTRTITGYEEGLYAWLAAREEMANAEFGIVEMGGASSQVTFPCEACGDARSILVQGEPVRLYSYSFLGLGQNEAFNLFGRTPACAQGVGLVREDWKIADCANGMRLNSDSGIRDPYNYGPDGRRGTTNDVPTELADVEEWVLTGAFRFMQETDIVNYCKNLDSTVFDPPTSCFRSVYQREYLKTLGVSSSSRKNEVNWTLGAVICGANDCLEQADEPLCRWSDEGCL